MAFFITFLLLYFWFCCIINVVHKCIQEATMFIEKFLNNGIPYLRLVESQRYTNNKGIRTVRKKSIYNVGPLNRFDDGKENYMDRLKLSFKNGTPIIPELQPYCTSQPVRKKYTIELSEGDPFCIGHPKLYSHCLIENILEELGLIAFFNKYKQRTNYEFDLTGFFRLLIYGRILHPASKMKTIKQNDDYYSPIIKNMYDYNIYDTLDFMYDYKINIINKLNKSLKAAFKRTTDIIYYDVTNFYFEIERPDEDIENDDGTITKGIRKSGVCKEERKLPIVQMGLFMDEQGIPISIETFPGNTLDNLTMIDALTNTIDELNLSRFIFVGDRGMYVGNNAAHLINTNNGYVISKSIQKTLAKERAWIFDNEGYTHEGETFKYKSRIVKRKVKIGENEYQDIVEKVVAYWSSKFYKKQMTENKSFLDFLKKLEENPESFRITKSQSKSIRKFIKKECMNDETGEVFDSNKLKISIDYDKVNAFKESFGYYQIVTSELEMSDKKVIETYHGLSRIENQFQTMKSDLETRPLYVRTNHHIEAHLLSCMIALIVIRIIQNKIVDFKGKSLDKYWELGLTGERIQDALNKWTVEELSSEYYRFNNLDDPDLKMIMDAFNIEIPVKLFKKGELREIKTNIKITT